MGLQGVHPYARCKEAYYEKPDLSSVLKEYRTDILFIDFCCMFFKALQTGPGTDIIKQSLENGWEFDHPDLVEAISQFIDHVLKHIQHIRNGKKNLDICLVIDGRSIPAKKGKCEARKSRQCSNDKNNFCWKIKKTIQQELESRNDLIPYREYLKPRAAIATSTKTNKQQKRRQHHSANKKGTTYFHFAPYEADAEIVYLCDQLPKSNHGAIMSMDGDLFAYSGAFDALVGVSFYHYFTKETHINI